MVERVPKQSPLIVVAAVVMALPFGWGLGIFAAYLIGWGVFFLFYLSIAKRTSDLKKEISNLKNSLNRGK